MKPIAESG